MKSAAEMQGIITLWNQLKGVFPGIVKLPEWLLTIETEYNDLGQVRAEKLRLVADVNSLRQEQETLTQALPEIKSKHLDLTARLQSLDEQVKTKQSQLENIERDYRGFQRKLASV